MKQYTQNDKIEQVTEKTLVVGVDIGSTKQYARAFDYRGREMDRVFWFMDCRSGYELFLKWMQGLQSAKGMDKIIVGAEPTGHYWFGLRRFLDEAGIQLVLVNPLHVSKAKELDDNNQTKSDLKDPKVIARLVTEGRYSVPYIPRGVYAELRNMWFLRQRVVDSEVKLRNRIARWFKIYFPEDTQAYGSFAAKSSIALLKAACMPEDILQLGADGIVELWRAMKLRAVGKKKAGSLLAAAARSTGQKEGTGAARMEMQMLLDEWELLSKQHQQIDEKLKELCEQIPKSENLLAIKGIGFVTVAGFLAEVGDIKRFDSPKQIVKLAGLALRENSSGKHKGKTTISKRGRARLRKLLFAGVIPLLATNDAFHSLHVYYTTRKQNPPKKKQSVIAICCKLVRIFYALLTKGTAFDSSKMLGDIHRPQLAA